MKAMSTEMDMIKERIQAIRLKMSSKMDTTETFQDSLRTYDCPECKDMGFVIKEWTGSGLAAECRCLIQKRIEKKIKSAMIPEEFRDATFENYKVTSRVQKQLYTISMRYVQDFEKIKDSHSNSLGFIAEFGEQSLERRKYKKRYNSFGLGKTHLQVAIAKKLIKKGYSVLIVSDVQLMEELMAKKREYVEDYNKSLHTVSNVPILVWDDIGKSSPTESKKSAYYQIINERYRNQRPIIFSSNEDVETLADRIGDASSSRLLSMARGRLCQVSGPDYRLVGDLQ